MDQADQAGQARADRTSTGNVAGTGTNHEHEDPAFKLDQQLVDQLLEQFSSLITSQLEAHKLYSRYDYEPTIIEEEHIKNDHEEHLSSCTENRTEASISTAHHPRGCGHGRTIRTTRRGHSHGTAGTSRTTLSTIIEEDHEHTEDNNDTFQLDPRLALMRDQLLEHFASCIKGHLEAGTLTFRDDYEPTIIKNDHTEASMPTAHPHDRGTGRTILPTTIEEDNEQTEASMPTVHPRGHGSTTTSTIIKDDHDFQRRTECTPLPTPPPIMPPKPALLEFSGSADTITASPHLALQFLLHLLNQLTIIIMHHRSTAKFPIHCLAEWIRASDLTKQNPVDRGPTCTALFY